MAPLNRHSESPRVQQIILHQKLKEELEKNSNGRIRYVDSELYIRNNQRSPNSGISDLSAKTSKHNQFGGGGNSSPKISKQTSIAGAVKASPIDSGNNSSGAKLDRDLSSDRTALQDSSSVATKDQLLQDNDRNGCKLQAGGSSSKNCQVCFIKEVRQNLMNINKAVQERNEQISKLKARCLRSHFERQMME